MELRDGFIVGIFNYCDRWCQTCASTSRCRLFADVAEAEAALDPNLKPVVDAPPLPQDAEPPPPPWMELIDEMNQAAQEPLTDTEIERLEPRMALEHLEGNARAHTYSDRVHEWFRARGWSAIEDCSDPRAVVRWFGVLIPAKVYRALTGLADDIPEERDWPADHDGSAKVALVGIDRSLDAWRQIVERGLAPGAETAPFIADLVWLRDELERVFPNARVFVRPAFDEPDEVARLLAAERGLAD